MNIAEIAVKRPITIIMVYFGVVLLGLISWFKIPQELFPAISYPQLTVITNYGNAAPEEVETLITKIIEEAVGTVSNLKGIHSTSKEGVSLVTAEFSWGTDMDFAALGVREKIDLVKERLPRDASEPIVVKYNPFELPVIILSITGERPPIEMLNIVRRNFKENLEKLEGVASCNISGGQDREIKVHLDQDRLRASGISITAITEALSASNLNYPAGTIKERFYEYLIRTMGEFAEVDEIGDTVVSLDDRDEDKRNQEDAALYTPDYEDANVSVGLGRRLVYLSDIAEVEDGVKERTSYSRYNGVPNISVSVQKQAAANIIEVSKKVRKELALIQNDIPEDVQFEVIYDQAAFIKNAIMGVVSAGWQGGLIAFFVLLYFLNSLLSATIVSTAIPVSIMAAFSLMFFKDISINMMSLAGLALGIGMMVDNSIVVIENVARLRQQIGKKPKEAAIEGTLEVGTAVIASTLTTVAVFLPMVFVVGIAGQIFKDLSFTVCFALVASLVVSLTLIPRLSVSEKEYKEKVVRVSFIRKVLDWPMDMVEGFYNWVIVVFLRFRKMGLLFIFLLFICSVGLLTLLNKEFMPKVDQGQFMVKITMPTGTLLDVTNEVVKKVEAFVLTLPDVNSVTVSIGADEDKDKAEGSVESLGSHQGQIAVELKKDREHGSKWVLNMIKEKIFTMPMGRAHVEYIVNESAIALGGGGAGAPVSLEVRGHDLHKLKEIAESLVGKLQKVPGAFSVKHDFPMPSPETKVKINRDKAALYGLSVTDIAEAAQIALKGSVATKFKEEGKEVDIRVRLRKQDRRTFSKLQNIMIYSKANNQDVPLSEVAYLVRGMGPSAIKRKDQERVIQVTSDIYQRSLSHFMTDVTAILEKIKLPSTYKIIVGGESEKMRASFQSMQFALILAILLVYMIMSSQFESLWQPFIIMLTVPLSLIGVAAALFLTGMSLNVVVILGIIMLGGIVVNNGIVLISCANDLRASGKSAYQSAVESGKLRLRPILMTTLTTVLGLIPLSLGLAEGAEMQQPMAITVMGGLLISTFLTLVVIPALYIISENVASKLFKRERIVLTDSGPKRID